MIEKLVLGTAQLGFPYGVNNIHGKPSMVQAQTLLATAYRNGIRYLDTAEAYGDSQDVIGTYHYRAGDCKFDVISKYNGRQSFPKENDFSIYFLSKLAVLGVSSLEAYLFHNFNVYQHFTHWEELEQLVLDGYIKHLGVSVYTNEQAQVVASDERLRVVQLPFNLLDNFYQRGGVLSLLKKSKKEVHVRSVFLQGLFYKNRELLGALSPLRKELLHLDALAQIQKLSIGSLALGYCLQQPLIDKVLIGVETEEQLLDNISLIAKAEKIDSNIFAMIDNIQVRTPELLNPTNWS